MRLTDIPLSWVVASAVLLVGALAALVVRSRTRQQDEARAMGAANRANDAGGTGGTSAAGGRLGGREQPGRQGSLDGERRRRKETLYATAAYLLLFCCAAVAAALSFHGLVGFGRQNLRLSGGWEYLVPFGLDGAAMFSAVIAVREASHGDASLGSRLLVWMFAGAAAWFNWVHAPRGVDHAGAPQFFAGMSLSAAILFDRALKQTRRAALREQGLVPRPLPQIRIVRWLRAPRETFRAWSLMLLEGVPSLDEAVDEVRDERRRTEQDRQRQREQRKVDRARVKALNRQHRSWPRGRGAGTAAAAAGPGGRVSVELAADLAAAGAAGAAGRLPAPARRALGTAADGGGPEAGRSPDAGDAPDDGAAEPGATAERSRNGGNGGAAGPRLDSLEEKLAEIERQFG